jgi:hypothetical protein
LSGSKLHKNHNPPGRLADGMVFWSLANRHRVAAVELKSKNPRPSTVQAQLQAGADLIAKLATDFPNLQFVAVVASKRVRSLGYQRFQKLRVTFRGREYPIRIVKCGASLDSLY